MPWTPCRGLVLPGQEAAVKALPRISSAGSPGPRLTPPGWPGCGGLRSATRALPPWRDPGGWHSPMWDVPTSVCASLSQGKQGRGDRGAQGDSGHPDMQGDLFKSTDANPSTPVPLRAKEWHWQGAHRPEDGQLWSGSMLLPESKLCHGGPHVLGPLASPKGR